MPSFSHPWSTGLDEAEARTSQKPIEALTDAVMKIAGPRRIRQGQEQDLIHLINVVARRIAGGLLLGLDQFEEFLILTDASQQKAFTSFLSNLSAASIANIRLLLVFRSDYQIALEDMGLPRLREMENWQQIGCFTLAAANRFMKNSGLGLRADALDYILTSAADMDDSPGLVRPITLNVIGHVLTEGGPAASSLDAGLLVGEYVKQAVEQPAIREFVTPVLERMITEQGTKRPSRREEDLATETGLRLAEVRAVLNGLGAAALARSSNSPAGTRVWELSHDFVARALVRYLGRRRHTTVWRLAYYAGPSLLTVTLLASASAVGWNKLVV